MTKVEESHDGGFTTTLYEVNNDRLLVYETLPTVTLVGGGTQTLEYAYDYIYGTNNVTLGNVWKARTLSNAQLDFCHHVASVSVLVSWRF